MLSYQQNYFNPCVELTRELWERVASDPSLQETVHNCTDIYSRLGKGAAYDAQKKKLPLVMFCCTFDPNNGAKGKQPLNTWRCQSAVNINGLFMYDAKIKFPARYHFRFCDKLLMQFVYAGLSFDRLIIDPKYKSTNRTADADNVEVHIYVQDDPKDNRLQIKFHR